VRGPGIAESRRYSQVCAHEVHGWALESGKASGIGANSSWYGGYSAHLRASSTFVDCGGGSICEHTASTGGCATNARTVAVAASASTGGCAAGVQGLPLREGRSGYAGEGSGCARGCGRTGGRDGSGGASAAARPASGGGVR